MAKNNNNKASKPPHVSANSLTGDEAQRDLKDSARDKERLKPDEATLDLPDVNDIPGQQNVPIPPPHSLGDATIASDDEEGVGIFDDEENADTPIEMGTEADVSARERNLLRQADETLPTEEEQRLRQAALDSQDFEGERLNEGSMATDRTGEDLDIPGEQDNSNTESLGQNDEENSRYSLGSDKNDNIVEGTP